MVKSGYVLAGFETLSTIVNNFILNTKNRYEDNFSRADISKFLSNTCSGFLHSFGQNFSGRNKYDKYIQTEKKVYQTCRDTKLFDNCNFIADSGGFQASIGKLQQNETENLIKLYYEFLSNHHEVLERAFILDLPPGPGCVLFNTFDDVYRENLKTYRLASNLPKESKEKIIYIHHFRTPKLWEIYTRIMRENELFKEFQFHGTGGIVANQSSDTAIPCIIYVLPIIPLINEAKKYNKSFLNFHILGGANFRDILFYELFKIHVRNIHKLELNITYDSSGLFKGLMIGRYMLLNDEETLRKVDLRSSNINGTFDHSKKERKVNQVFKEELNKMAVRNNFKEIEMTDIYDAAADTFFEEVKVYAMLYMLEQFAIVQERMKIKAVSLYHLYQTNNLQDFNNQIVETTQELNSGKITRKQKAKSSSISKSLDMLTNLDETYCQYIVNKCLSKDEFSDLSQGSLVVKMS
jgi:hypothetical protein